MQEAVPAGGAMAAVLGLDAEKIERSVDRLLARYPLRITTARDRS